MKNSTYTWVTIKYQDELFDVHLTEGLAIDEVRAVDSEINIAPILSEATIHSMQSIATEHITL